MLNLNDINETIKDLETNASTTFDTCNKLASLYIVRNNMQNVVDDTEKELSDILPRYKSYCEIKKDYQLGRTTEQAVYKAMDEVGREIKEFIHILYSNTDTKAERQILKETINELYRTL